MGAVGLFVGGQGGAPGGEPLPGSGFDTGVGDELVEVDFIRPAGMGDPEVAARRIQIRVVGNRAK